MANRHQWFSVLLASATFLIAPALYAEPAAKEQPKSAIKASAPATDKSATEAKEIQRQLDYASDQNEYHIGPLDLLEIQVLQDKELSRSVRVDSRGNISLPLLGIVHAGGLTSYELEQKITEKLAVDLIQDPQVSVFIKEFTSQRITVQGIVKKAGVYDFQGRATLLQAISMGGGLDEKANESSVKVIRKNPTGVAETMSFDLTAIRQNKQPDPLLLGGDVVVVEESIPITVEGQVTKPGVYYPRGPATLMQLISQSGGLTDIAQTGAIKVFSTGSKGEKVTLEYDIEKIRDGKLKDPVVNAGDVVVVEKSGGLAILQGITNTLRGFIGFGTIR